MNGPALALAAAFVGLSAAALASAPPAPRETVVFVCEHGTVKSLIAREWFNRRATERGLRVRAVSRGVVPDPSVPPAIAEALRADGFDVTGFHPQPFTEADARGAVRIVGIGVDLAASAARAGTPLDSWDGIPPASERYGASRDALRARIDELLDVLEGAARRP